MHGIGTELILDYIGGFPPFPFLFFLSSLFLTMRTLFEIAYLLDSNWKIFVYPFTFSCRNILSYYFIYLILFYLFTCTLSNTLPCANWPRRWLGLTCWRYRIPRVRLVYGKSNPPTLVPASVMFRWPCLLSTFGYEGGPALHNFK